MELIFYYILRRFFMHLRVENNTLLLRKGLVFRRYYHIPLKAIRRIDIRRTPLMRLLKGKKVMIHTFSGKISFFLQRDEPFDPIHSRVYPAVRPHFSSVIAAAFSQTKALGGTVLFTVTITRLGKLFGSDYYTVFADFVNNTADGLDELLEILHIAVPKATTALAVFVAAAWLFTFVHNIIRLSRYTVIFGREALTVRHGMITLYETIFPSDTIDTVIVKDTVVTLVTGAAPIYRSGCMVIPPLCGEKRRKALHSLCPAPCYDLGKRPPPKAFFGHIAVPFGWGSIAAVLLVFACFTGSHPVLRTLLWGMLWISVWLCILYAIYMRRSGISVSKGTFAMTARRGTELLTAYIPLQGCACLRTDSNPFQRHSGMCDVRIFAAGRIKLRLRNMRRNDISAPW